MRKVIEGFEDYEVDEHGNVWSYRSTMPACRRLKPLKLKPRFTEGYAYVALTRGLGVNKQRQQFKLHRLVALHFLDNPQQLQEVNHKDGNKANNAVSNLEWASRESNMQHAVASGLHDMVSSLGKTYTVVSPAGERVTFKGLNKFARDNGLYPSPLKEVIDGKRKQHKGWTKA